LVRTSKESEQARGTHFLERVEGRTSQDIERKQASGGDSQTGDEVRTSQDMESKQASKEHSQPGEGRVQDWSRFEKKGNQ